MEFKIAIVLVIAILIIAHPINKFIKEWGKGIGT